MNINQLSVEQPKADKALVFDQERDLDEKTWQSILERAFDERKHDETNFIGLAEDLAVLAPERRKELELTEEIWNKLLNNTDELIDVSSTTNVGLAFSEDFSDTMYTLKTLFPEKVHQLSLDEQTHSKLINLYDFLKSRRQDQAEARKVLRLASNIKFLFPQFGDEWGESTKRGTQIDIIGVEMLDRLSAEKNWGAFALVSRQLRYLFPDDKLEYGNAAWKEMRAKLESNRSNEHWFSYAQLAANMKVLAAEKVMVTEQGLELVMPKAKAQLAEQTPGMPDIRKF